MKKQITALLLSVVFILSLYVTSAVAAETEFVKVSIENFSESSVLNVTDSFWDGNKIVIKGTNSGGLGHCVTFAAYSDTVNLSVQTLTAIGQTWTNDKGAFVVSIEPTGSIDRGIITIGADNADVSVSAAFSVEHPIEIVSRLEEMSAEIEQLVNECEKAGIPIDYAKVKGGILKRFTEIIKQDYDRQDSSRMSAQFESLQELYGSAKKELASYLAGDAIPIDVPSYVTSKVRFDGTSIMAQTEQDGTVSEKPTFYSGYTTWENLDSIVETMSDVGANYTAVEIGPYDVLFKPDAAKNWSVTTGGFLRSGTDAKLTTEAKAAGNYAMKLSNTTARDGSAYLGIAQRIAVEPGAVYNVSFKIKGGTAGAIYCAFGNSGRVYVNASSAEFETKTFTYTASGEASTALFRVVSEDVSADLYVDEVMITKRGSSVNLVANSGFENGEADTSNLVNGFRIDYDKLNRLKAGLELAEEKNIRVSVLLAPHYFPGWLCAEDETINSGKTVRTEYMPVNPTHPRVQQTLETYLDIVIPQIKDYVALDSIIIANEPAFLAGYNGTSNAIEYYIPKWQAFLKEKYGTIAALNTKYGTSHSDFAAVSMPAWGNIENADYKDKRSIDYIEFNNSILYDFHKYMSERIRQLAPEVKLQTKVMEYLPMTGEYTINASLQSGNEYEAWSKLLDINGCDGSISYSTANKAYQATLQWYDFMRSVKEAPIYNTEDHSIRGTDSDGNINYTDANRKWMGVTMWEGAFHGKAASAMWHWGHTDTFISGSMKGQTFSARPAEVWELSKATLDLNRLAEEVTAVQKREARVAMLYSDYSSQWTNNYRNALYQAYCECMYNGQKVDFITDYSPEKLNEKEYDLLIAVQPKNVSEKTLTEIRKFISDGGKVLLTGSEPLQRNKYNEAYASSMYSDIVANSETVNYGWTRQYYVYDSNNEIKNKIAEMIAVYVTGANKIKIVDAETGVPVSETDWGYTEFEGDVLVNLYSFDTENTKNVKILIDGKTVGKSEDLISGMQYADTVTLSPYAVQLLRISDKAKDTAPSIRLSAVTFDSEFNAAGEGAQIVDYNLKNPKNGAAMASLYIPSGANMNKPLDFMIAVYENGRMIDCSTQTRIFPEDMVAKVAVPVKAETENTVIKAFLWDETYPVCGYVSTEE